MKTEAINHDPAHTFMNTGTTISGRPSMGSWVTYGLGSETRRPARLRRADLDRAAAGRRSRSPRGSGTAASCRAGSRASQFRSQGRPGALRQQPAGRRRREQQRDVVDAVQQLERAANDAGRRPRDRDADRAVRDGVPDAGQRAGADGHLRTSRKDVLELYGTKRRRRLVRRQLPAGPPAGRARRAVHPALPPRLGPPRRHQGRHQADGRGGRPGGARR